MVVCLIFYERDVLHEFPRLRRDHPMIEKEFEFLYFRRRSSRITDTVCKREIGYPPRASVRNRNEVIPRACCELHFEPAQVTSTFLSLEEPSLAPNTHAYLVHDRPSLAHPHF